MDKIDLNNAKEIFPVKIYSDDSPEPKLVPSESAVQTVKSGHIPVRHQIKPSALSVLAAGLVVAESGNFLSQPKPHYGKKGGLVTAATFKPKKKFRKKKGK